MPPNKIKTTIDSYVNQEAVNDMPQRDSLIVVFTLCFGQLNRESETFTPMLHQLTVQGIMIPGKIQLAVMYNRFHFCYVYWE